MNKKQIIERINLLQKEREALASQIHAYTGAIQDCEYWLAQIKSKEEKIEIEKTNL